MLFGHKADIYRLLVFVAFFSITRFWEKHFCSNLRHKNIFRDLTDCLKRLHKEHKNILLDNNFFRKFFWIKATRNSNEAWSVKSSESRRGRAFFMAADPSIKVWEKSRSICWSLIYLFSCLTIFVVFLRFKTKGRPLPLIVHLFTIFYRVLKWAIWQNQQKRLRWEPTKLLV